MAKYVLEIDKSVDTVFEIGGQDSKYISLENGAIVDFEMNKVCAAGTGSFLEEQADRLKINIKDEFGECALSANYPLNLGERCTVFMQSQLVEHQQFLPLSKEVRQARFGLLFLDIILFAS